MADAAAKPVHAPDPLRAWAEREVLGPAAAVFAGVLPWVRVACPKCDGGSRRPAADRPCRRCEGAGTIYAQRQTPEWRAEVDRRLRAAGLDPACFDDRGRLLKAETP